MEDVIFPLSSGGLAKKVTTLLLIVRQLKPMVRRSDRWEKSSEGRFGTSTVQEAEQLILLDLKICFNNDVLNSII